MPLRVLKNRGFLRTARKGGLTDRTLCAAVTEIEARLIDAQLGGPLLKKRLGKGGRGKSGGFRTIAAYRQRDRVMFLYVFGKNERDNITEQERVALSEIGDEYLGLPSEKLDELVAKGTLIEVVCDGDEKEDEPNPC
jgi:hypothetical protein